MKINGYEVALSEADLDDKLNNQTVDVDLIKPDFPAYRQLSDGDKKAFAHLVKAARMFNDVFLEQDHKLDIELKEALEDKAASDAYAAKVLRFFNSLNGVEGLNGIDKEPVEIFKGVKGNPGRNFYPDDLSAEELQEILIKMLEEGKVDEVKKILSVRTMVRRHGDELKAIDFTEYFAREFSDIANEIELAAHYTTDEPLKDYLGWQAQALLQDNEDMDMLADKHWAVLQDTPIEFTIARENYNDELTSTVFDNPRLAALLKEHRIEVNAKDSIGVRVGLVNREGTDLILKFKNHMCELAKLMPYCERYEQNVSAGGELKQTMVDVDLAVVTGDFAAVRGGMTVAENLPNNDKLAIKTGAAAVMYTIARFVSLLMPRAMPNFWTNWLSRGFIGILTSKQNTFLSSDTKTGILSARTARISPLSVPISTLLKNIRLTLFRWPLCPNMSKWVSSAKICSKRFTSLIRFPGCFSRQSPICRCLTVLPI